jgi:hypothetical protein
MKAYILGIRDDDDQGEFVVFADNAQEARKLVNGTDLQYERWIDVRSYRAKRWDNLEHLDDAHLHLELWKEGWRWLFTSYPDPETDTDETFLAWYEDAFGETK